MSQSSTTSSPSPFKVNSKTKSQLVRRASSSPQQPKPISSTPQSVPPDPNKDFKMRRSTLLTPLNAPKSADHRDNMGNHAARMSTRPRTRPVVEQLTRPSRQRQVYDHPCATERNAEAGGGAVSSKKDLKDEKLELSEALLKDLQSQLLALKKELEETHALNTELASQNKKLSQDLAAAEAKAGAALLDARRLQESTGENCQSHKFKDIQKIIASKLEQSSVKVTRAPSPPPPPPPPSSLPVQSKVAGGGTDTPSCPSLPPLPPPPPPPLRPLARAPRAPRTPPVLEVSRSLRKQEENRDAPRSGNQYKTVTNSAHSSIVGEIQNRSAHLLAIKVDIETKGDFINNLIQKVLAAAYTDIEDVLKFVDWLDAELSSLADERAVLKHFEWPEKKADIIREAAIEYRGLKELESEISSYRDDSNIPCGTALKKMAVLLDRSEHSMERLVKLRNSAMRSYQAWEIPVDWMLDSGIVSKIKEGSKRLAKTYMKRVARELKLSHNSDRESNQEALLRQGVNFACRARQFAGGLDSETLCVLEEIRQRVPGRLGGSRELLAAVPTII